MTAADLTRTNYFERQHLGPLDLLNDQSYHARMLRAHWLAAHVWGIYHGLRIEKDPVTQDWIVSAGLAIDAWGRTLIQPQNFKINIDDVARALTNSAGAVWVGIWIRYHVEPGSPTRATCTDASQPTRKRELTRIDYLVGLPTFEGVPNSNPAAEPTPITIPATDIDTAGWPVLLGAVQYDPVAKAIVGARLEHAGEVRRDVGHDVVSANGPKLIFRSIDDPSSTTPQNNLDASLLGRLSIATDLTVTGAASFGGVVSLSKGATDTDPRLIVGDTGGKHLDISPATITAAKGNANTPSELQLQPLQGEVSINAGTTPIKFQAGKLGIGTSAPAVALHVRDATDPRVRLDSGTKFYDVRVAPASGTLQFTNDGGTPLQIDQQGNIAINEPNPNSTIDLGSTAARPASLRFVRGANVAKFQLGSDGTLLLMDAGDITRYAFGSLALELNSRDLELRSDGGAGRSNITFKDHNGAFRGQISSHATTSDLLFSVTSGSTPEMEINDAGEVIAKTFVSTGVKNFVIDHPLRPADHQLVHACIEGPEVAVYYRGRGELRGGRAVVHLPEYFEALTRPEDRCVQLTPCFNTFDEPVSALAASNVMDGAFAVKGLDDRNPTQTFYWIVTAVRADLPALQVERAKKSRQNRDRMPCHS